MTKSGPCEYSSGNSRGAGEPTPVGQRFLDLCARYQLNYKTNSVPLEIQETFWREAGLKPDGLSVEEVKSA